MQGNDYGDLKLSVSLPSLSIDDLVKSLRGQFERSLLNEPVYIGDLPVRLAKTATGQGGYRYWFICPNCGTRGAKLYFTDQGAICRHCAAIKYPSSRYKGMVEEQGFKKDQ